jgi:hypothetical protein
MKDVGMAVRKDEQLLSLSGGVRHPVSFSALSYLKPLRGVWSSLPLAVCGCDTQARPVLFLEGLSLCHMLSEKGSRIVGPRILFPFLPGVLRHFASGKYRVASTTCPLPKPLPWPTSKRSHKSLGCQEKMFRWRMGPSWWVTRMVTAMWWVLRRLGRVCDGGCLGERRPAFWNPKE